MYPALQNIAIPGASNSAGLIISEISTCRTEIATREGYMEKRHNTGTVNVGVDASTWFYAAQGAFSSAHRRNAHAQVGANPELRCLVYRLAWLSRSGVNAVFVFDGPNRPKMKRGKAVRAMPHWLTEAFQDFISAYGFYSYTAPGEAEAELAFLNGAGYVDMVMTSDSDILVFGGSVVLRSVTNKQVQKKADEVELYTINGDGNTFSQADFVFIAILSGGDYNPGGAQGCGSVAAKAIARHHPQLAQDLFRAGKFLKGSALTEELCNWRERLHDILKYDPRGLIQRKYPAAANALPAVFPDPKILKLYCNPITSQQQGGPGVQADDWLVPRLPNNARLSVLLKMHFGWRDNILRSLQRHVWDGLFIRQLIQKKSIDITTLPIEAVQKVGRKNPSRSAPPSFLVKFSTISLIQEASDAVITAANPTPLAQHNSDSILMTSVWIPEPIVRFAAAQAISAFFAKRPTPRIREYHGSAKPARVMGMGIHGYGCGSDLATHQPIKTRAKKEIDYRHHWDLT
ncbi:PIN domain-like protein [Agrocybe pediades]|nr:PIN domain-like protein [Agrocybe pediades]